MAATTLRNPGPVVFEAELLQSPGSGAACFVDFPYDLKALYGKGNLVPVVVTWDGHVRYRGSLAMMGGANALCLARKDVLAQLGKRAGDRVHVQVELDTEPREVELPPALAEALAGAPEAAAAWPRLSPSCQREYASWIGEAKRPETLVKRVQEALPMILAGRRLKG